MNKMKLKTTLLGKTYTFKEIKDVLAKSLGSSNAGNVAKATFKAITALSSKDAILAKRGIEKL